MDSDCVPPEGWLEPLLGHFDDPMVAAVAPRIVSPPARTNVLARYERIRSLLDQGTTPAPVRPGGRVSYVPSAAMVVRADIAEGPDLFDPSLRGGEDVDLVWRLHEAGWDVRYVPGSVVTHDGPADTLSIPRAPVFLRIDGRARSRRHHDDVRPVEISGWTLAVWALVLAGRPTMALTTLEASIAVLADRLSGLVRDPVAVATRIAGTRHSPGRTARARRPGEGMVSGARPRPGLSPDASSGRAGARASRPQRLGRRHRNPRPRPVHRAPRARRRCLWHRGVGRGVLGSERWSHCCRASCGVRERGPPSRCDNPSGPGPPKTPRVTFWRNAAGRAGAPSRKLPRI